MKLRQVAMFVSEASTLENPQRVCFLRGGMFVSFGCHSSLSTMEENEYEIFSFFPKNCLRARERQYISGLSPQNSEQTICLGEFKYNQGQVLEAGRETPLNALRHMIVDQWFENSSDKLALALSTTECIVFWVFFQLRERGRGGGLGLQVEQNHTELTGILLAGRTRHVFCLCRHHGHRFCAVSGSSQKMLWKLLIYHRPLESISLELFSVNCIARWQNDISAFYVRFSLYFYLNCDFHCMTITVGYVLESSLGSGSGGKQWNG